MKKVLGIVEAVFAFLGLMFVLSGWMVMSMFESAEEFLEAFDKQMKKHNMEKEFK